MRKYLANGEGLGLTPSSLLSDSFITSKTWAWGHVLLPFGGAHTLHKGVTREHRAAQS